MTNTLQILSNMNGEMKLFGSFSLIENVAFPLITFLLKLLNQDVYF